MTSSPQVAPKSHGNFWYSKNGFSPQIVVITLSCAYAPSGWGRPVVDLGSWHGGVMRIGRAIIIPAIVALGMAGSALIGSALPAAAASAPNSHVVTTSISTGVNVYHHG